VKLQSGYRVQTQAQARRRLRAALPKTQRGAFPPSFGSRPTAKRTAPRLQPRAGLHQRAGRHMYRHRMELTLCNSFAAAIVPAAVRALGRRLNDQQRPRFSLRERRMQPTLLTTEPPPTPRQRIMRYRAFEMED
jgi:hypothetical protein